MFDSFWHLTQCQDLKWHILTWQNKTILFLTMLLLNWVCETTWNWEKIWNLVFITIVSCLESCEMRTACQGTLAATHALAAAMTPSQSTAAVVPPFLEALVAWITPCNGCHPMLACKLLQSVTSAVNMLSKFAVTAVGPLQSKFPVCIIAMQGQPCCSMQLTHSHPIFPDVPGTNVGSSSFTAMALAFCVLQVDAAIKVTFWKESWWFDEEEDSSNPMMQTASSRVDVSIAQLNLCEAPAVRGTQPKQFFEETSSCHQHAVTHWCRLWDMIAAGTGTWQHASCQAGTMRDWQWTVWWHGCAWLLHDCNAGSCLQQHSRNDSVACHGCSHVTWMFLWMQCTFCSAQCCHLGLHNTALLLLLLSDEVSLDTKQPTNSEEQCTKKLSQFKPANAPFQHG